MLFSQARAWTWLRAMLSFALTIIGTSDLLASDWLHNGSVINLEANGNAVKMTYVTPRANISTAPGTLLFEGVKDGSAYRGTAYRFLSGCAPLAYPVTGSLAPDGAAIQLSGDYPKRDAN